METLQEIQQQKAHWEQIMSYASLITLGLFILGLTLSFYAQSKVREFKRKEFDIEQKEWQKEYEQRKAEVEESTKQLNQAIRVNKEVTRVTDLYREHNYSEEAIWKHHKAELEAMDKETKAKMSRLFAGH